MWARGMGVAHTSESCSVALCLTCLRQSLSLYLELGWHPGNPSDPHVSTPTELRLKAQTALLSPGFYMGVWVSSTRLHACAASTSPLSDLRDLKVCFIESHSWARKMAQQLRAVTALAGNPCPVGHSCL